MQVVNNQRISVTQRQSVLDAMALAEQGRSAVEIKEVLERDKFESSIYIMVDTLYYLKKGGRITPAAAALGTLLKLKPVLQIQGEKLDAFAKARTVKQAKNLMIEAMKHDFAERFHDPEGKSMHLEMAYTYDLDAAEAFRQEVQEAFPGLEIHMDPLSLSVSCHIGPGALAVALEEDSRAGSIDKIKQDNIKDRIPEFRSTVFWVLSDAFPCEGKMFTPPWNTASSGAPREDR